MHKAATIWCGLALSLAACTSRSPTKPLGGPPPLENAATANRAGTGAPPSAPVLPVATAGSPGLAGPDAGLMMMDAAADEDAGRSDDEDAGSCVDCCPDGFPRGMPSTGTQEIIPFTPSPADVTVCPNGDAFLTLDGPDEVWRVPISGQASRYASVAGMQPAGIACDDKGRLFVAGFATRARSSFTGPAILLIEKEGAAARALQQPDGATLATPNGVTFVPGAGIYSTDTLSGTIVVTREAFPGLFESTVAADGLFFVSGIAYDPKSRKLYVGSSFTQQIMSLPVAKDGTLGASKLEWTVNQGLLIDGLAVDENGSVYVASYQSGSVIQLPGQNVVARVTNPASLAFHGGSLLVVDYHLNEPTQKGGLYQAKLARCGADLFGPRQP